MVRGDGRVRQGHTGPRPTLPETVLGIYSAEADPHPAEPPGALAARCWSVALAVAIGILCGAAGALWHWGPGR
jgi:hypothetical protein